MNQAKLSLKLQCPHHEGEDIVMLNETPNARKMAFCSQCIEESNRDGAVIQALKSFSSYLKDKSAFYEKCRKKVDNAGEAPAEYVEELLKKGERLEKFSQHLDQEKNKVKKSFEEIRRIVLQMINEKEKECLELLDKELLDLSAAYSSYEKLLKIGWPKPLEIQNTYPEIGVLKQRMSQIESVDQLQAFMTGIQEDVQIHDLYFKEGDDVSKIKKKIDGLGQALNVPESSFPEIQSKILSPENLENFMKDIMKGFSQLEMKVENSIGSRMKASTYESKIIFDDQFETLRDWLPKGYKFDLKLLFRGSADGMSGEKFHEKCDGKGATITLVRCQFDGAQGPHTLGGFIDQSWHSKSSYSNSKEAFLFSLGEQQATSFKCPILETEFQNAFYGGPQYGPIFGGGNDVYIHDGLRNGQITPSSYSNAIALRHGYGNKFTVEEIEVFQVL